MLSVMPRLGKPGLRQVASALFATFVSSSSSAFTAQKPFGFHNHNLVLRGGAAPTKSLTTTPTTSRFTTMSSAAVEDVDATTAPAMTPAAKLDALRSKMAELDLDVYLVPSDDPHLSEYVPAAYMRRKFLSGFGGSAGTAVVFRDGDALLWADSRYWNEAGLQLDAECWTLMKQGQPKVPTIVKKLAEVAVEHYSKGGKPMKVGIDPFVHPASFAKEFNDAMEEAAKKELDVEEGDDVIIGELDTSHPNLIDPIWGSARPDIPTSPFRVHPLEYAGVSLEDKVTKIRKEMEEKKATLSVFSTLDDVAYLMNMRAMGDIETCPVGIAYATVGKDDVTLYCDPKKLESDDVQAHLSGVTLKPYDAIIDDIKSHCEDSSSNKVWLDTSRANYALTSVIPTKALVDSHNAVTPMKASKNEAEMEGMRKAHVVDGVAMAHFIAWLEDQIVNQGSSISEVEIDEVLTGYRAEQPGFLECSFPTIAGVASNGAIVHYRAAPDSELLKYLDKTQPILIDSGGQYTYGTTDVTRTWHFGEPTQEFCDVYTRVLKGNIGVDSMIFPENVPGFVLDVFARKALWEAGLDYGHGTGHGVGAALNVHEGPHSISPRYGNTAGLVRGMVVSNEPGYYEDGNFGIRIENLLEMQYVKEEHNLEAEGEDSSGEKKFLKFARLTVIPIQKNLINVALMTKKELDWLDAYHQEVFAKVSPLLDSDSPAMKWLEKSCTKIDRGA